jgi:hypothetical protein
MSKKKKAASSLGNGNAHGHIALGLVARTAAAM